MNKKTIKTFVARLLAWLMLFQMLPVNMLAEEWLSATSNETGSSSGGAYTVTFASESGAQLDSFTVAAGSSVSASQAPTPPTIEGKAFRAWQVSGSDVSLPYTPTENVTLTAAYDNVYTVTFYNRDAQEYAVVSVKQGEAIGSLPGTITRDGYTAYWAVGEIRQGGQGPEIHVTGSRIDSSWKPEADTTIVPDYALITYTITFYDEDKTTPVGDPKEVSSQTSYCLNDIPQVPAKEGYIGKWVYSGGDFTNEVAVSGDTSVWAEYEKNVFTVTYMVEGTTYETDTYYTGDTLTLPAEPAVDGKQFDGWYLDPDDESTKIIGGEAVTSDLTLTAKLENEYEVTFVIKDDDGNVKERLHQYFRTEGETIGIMPQDPFVAEKVFEKWVIEGTETEVTAATPVTGNMTIVAVFREIDVYDITAEYYYIGSSGEVPFNTDFLQVEEHELPYTITAPSTTKTDPDEVSGAPIYYPETPTITVQKADFDAQHKVTVRFKYVPYTAEYDFVYKLKDLTGDSYTEIPDTRTHVYGVLNSYVTPTVKTFDYAVLELAEGKTIDQASGQELPVYYTRKNYQLTYETNGGSYVAGTTAPYGSTVTLSSADPTREGYTFAGWYLDEALTQPAGSNVELTEDTTVYAKWTGKTVNYTIVYMFEKYNDAGTASSFVYDNSETGSGTVGSTVYATDSSIPDKTKTGWEKDNAQNETSNVVIAADGSSVLYIYYKLKEYTFYFNAGTYTTGGYGSTTYDVNATLVDKGSSGTGALSYTMTVKLGQDISSSWPGNVTGKYTTREWDWYHYVYTDHDVDFDGWKPAGKNTRYVTKRTIVTDDMLPSSGTSITYTAQWTNNARTYTVNYWLQNADDDGYTKSEEYSQTYTSSSGNLSAKEIAGYTYDHGNSGASGVTEYNFYYNRDTFKIDYYHGSTRLGTIDNIKFDANINKSPYVWTPTAAQCGVDSDYTFAGWYDNESLSGDPYSFGLMPGHNVVLYAKWNAPTYTVRFLNDDGTTASVTNPIVTVEKYKKVENPGTPTKEGHTFDGWYTTADGNELFDWNMPITGDTAAYAHWTRNTISYTVHYVDEQGASLADDKIITNPNFVVGQTVTESAIAVAGYRPNESTKTRALTADNAQNVITFVYSQKVATTSYTVRYVIADGETGAGTAVAADKQVDNVPGDTASVIEMAPAVDYDTLYAAVPALQGIEFFPDAVEKTFVLTTSAESNVFTFYYTSFKNATVTVHFVDMNGDAIANDDVQHLKVGNQYTLARTPIAGWELNRAVEGTSYAGTEAKTESYRITEENAATGLTFTLFYQKKATITANSLTKQYDGNALTLPAELSGQVKVEGLLEGDSLASVNLGYTNADNDTEDGRINAGTATVTPSGAVINGHTGTYGSYYAIRYISGTLTVTKINVTIRIEPDRWTGNVYDGTKKKTGFTNGSKGIADYILISHEGYAADYLDDIWNKIIALDNVIYDASAAGLGYYVEAEKDAGNYTYDLSLTSAQMPDGDGNYSVSLFVRQGLLEIKPAPLTVTTGTDSKSYDGTPLTNDQVTLTGLMPGETATATATGSQTEIGRSSNTYTIAWGDTKASNYTITENLGNLTVTPATLTVTVNDISKVYNGSEQEGRAFVATVTGTGETITTDDYTIEGLGNGDVLTITYTPAKGIDVGEYTGAFAESYSITKGGVDVSASYETPTFTPGKLTITKRAVTLTSATDSKAYDGTPLTNSTVTVTGDGFVSGEGATYNVTGSQTLVGSSDNTFTYTLNEGTKADNYTITKVEGKLTITDRTEKYEITVVAKSNTGNVYDGTAKSATGFETLEFTVDGNTYTVSGLTTSDPSSVNVCELPNAISGTAVVKDAAGNDVTAQFDVSTTDGELEITAREVTVSVEDKTVEYNGSEQYGNTEYTFDNVVDGQTATITYTPSKGTLAGTYDNGAYTAESFKVMSGETDVTSNYTLGTQTKGKLTIVPYGSTDPDHVVTVTIVGNSNSANYDGQEHIASGYKVTINDPLGLYKESDFTFSGTAEAKRTYVVEGDDRDGQTDMGLTVEQFTNPNPNYANVTFEVTDGYQKIEKVGLLIKVNDKTVSYNGEKQTGYTVDGTFTGTGSPLSTEDYEITGLVTGDVLTVSAYTPAEGTNVGEYNGSVNDIVITVMKGTIDVTTCYELGATAGILEITKAPLTITAKDQIYIYDGNPHGEGDPVYEDPAVIAEKVTVEGLQGTDALTSIIMTGHETEVGVYKGKIEVTGATVGAATDNYEIKYVPGTLTITELAGEKTTPEVTSNYKLGDKIPFKITVTNPSDGVVKNVTVEDPNATILPGEGYTVSGNVATIAEIPAGATVEVKAEHEVTEEDIAAHLVDNKATITYGDWTKTVEASTDKIEDMYTLTIVYLYADGSPTGLKNYERTHRVPWDYSVTSPRIPGYSPDKPVVMGTLTEDTTVYVYYDFVPYTLTIHYVYTTGGTAAPDYTDTLYYQDSYDVTSPAIPGYAASQLVVSGRMPARNVTITVFYVPYGNLVTIDDLETPLGLSNVNMNAGEAIE